MVTHRTRITLAIVGAVVLGSVLGSVGTSRAVKSSFGIRVVIGGGSNLPMATTADGRINLRAGRELPVFLVTDGAVVPGSIGTATVSQWTDSAPSSGFGGVADLMVIRLGGGFMLIAAGIATAGGPVTTLSATAPVETLSGTWTMTGGTGSGVSGAAAGDLVVTLFPEFNTSNTLAGVVTFVAGGAVEAGQSSQPVPGLGSVQVFHNIPVLDVVNGAVGPRIGTLTGYTVNQGPEFDGLTAIDFGGVFALYGCAFPESNSGIACLVGGTGPIAGLSGEVSQIAGQFRKDIVGVTDPDLVLRFTVSLP
jgi:hypothetical protein